VRTQGTTRQSQGCSRVKELHVVGETSRRLGVIPASGIRDLGKAGVGPDAEDGAAQERRARARATSRRTLGSARDHFILGHFDHDFLPIFELKCTRW
jgi:hypothetical protein